MERLDRANRGEVEQSLQLLELANEVYDLYSQREPHEQRLLLDLLCSNSEMGGGKLKVELRKPFCYLRNLAEEARNDKTPLTEIKGVRPIWWALLDLNLSTPVSNSEYNPRVQLPQPYRTMALRGYRRGRDQR